MVTIYCIDPKVAKPTDPITSSSVISPLRDLEPQIVKCDMIVDVDLKVTQWFKCFGRFLTGRNECGTCRANGIDSVDPGHTLKGTRESRTAVRSLTPSLHNKNRKVEKQSMIWFLVWHREQRVNVKVAGIRTPEVCSTSQCWLLSLQLIQSKT